MKHFSNICRTLCVISLLFVVGCVDENYRIDQVDTEVTIGAGTTTLPLGSLERMTIKDLLKDTEGIDTLLTLKDGRYILDIGSDGVYNVGGIEHIIDIPKVGGEFTVEYPDFDLSNYAVQIDKYFDITPMLDNNESIPYGTFDVDEGSMIKGVNEDVFTEKLDYAVPEMISGVKRIYLKPTEEGDPGARVDMRFLLNDLGEVNNGGDVTLVLNVPEGYRLYDADGNAISTGELTIKEEFGAEDDELLFHAYVECVSNDKPVEDGAIEFEVSLEYHLSFQMTTKAGQITLSKGPQLHVKSDLQYEDADIVLNEYSLFDGMTAEDSNISVEDLPEEIRRIRSITFADESPLVLTTSGLEWMSEELAESIAIDVKLPEYVILHDNADIGYDAEQHALHTTLDKLCSGVEVDLDALDFGEEGLTPRAGKIEISFAPEINARIVDGTELKLSSITHDEDITLSAGIEATKLDIQRVSGYLEYSYIYNEMVELGDIDNLWIDGVGLEPVLRLELENPFTLDLMATYNVVPYINDMPQIERAVNTNNFNGVGYVNIPAATVVGGVVKPSKSVIVLGTEASRDKYSDCIFVPCDIDKLFKGEFPDELSVRVDIMNEPLKQVTLHTADKYELKYTYSVELPVELNNKTKLSYQQTIDFTEEGAENPFEQLAELPEIKLGDVAVIADVTTTLPVQLSASVEMLDSEGEVIDGLVALPQGGDSIVGSEDGVNPATSTLRLELHLNNQSITTLAQVAALRFRLEAAGVSQSSAPIYYDQYVEATLKLELSGGITADLKELGNM